MPDSPRDPQPPSGETTQDSPQAQSPSTHHRGPSWPAPEPGQLPSTIGPYRILKKLGEGGMGIVYLAEQEIPIRRQVALKVIKLGMDTQEVIARFESERQALALMSHPNIARVFEAGATEQGRPFFAMEYVGGVPITEFCDTQRLTTEERLRLFVKVCQAVQHAHQKGVIHRDLKPSNVVVALQDGQPVPSVIDFGVAKATNQRLTEKTLFTERGVLLGTPQYMSPEQADLTGTDIDTTSDIYSLGVMLYELLVGAHPFDPSQLRRVGYDELLRAIRETDPPRLRTRLTSLGPQAADVAARRRTTLGALQRQLAGDLDWIVHRAMEKDRARRYPAASELAADVERHLRHEPVVARPPSLAYQLSRFVARHRAPVAFAGVVFLLLIAFGAVMTVQAQRISREAETARQVSNFLVELFRVSDPSEARGSSVTAREILDRGTERVATGLKDQPVLQGRLMSTMGKVYWSLGLFRQAVPVLEQAISVRGEAHGEESTELAESLHDLATVKSQQAAYDEAEQLFRRSLAIREKRLGPNHADVAATLGGLGGVFLRRGKLPEATGYFQRGLAILDAQDDQSQLFAATLNALANVYADQGKFADAEPLYLRSLALWEKNVGPEHPQIATSLNNIGLLYTDMGKFAQAKPFHDRALAIREKVLGPEHHFVAQSLLNLALLHKRQGQLAEAEPLYLRALAIREKTVGPDHPDVGRILNNLASVLFETQRLDQAEALYRRALRIWETRAGPEHFEVGRAFHNLGLVSAARGRDAQAEAHYQRALRIWEKAVGPKHPEYGSLCRSIGKLYADRKQYAQAAEFYQHALAGLEVEAGSQSGRYESAAAELVAILRRLGRDNEARELEARLTPK